MPSLKEMLAAKAAPTKPVGVIARADPEPAPVKPRPTLADEPRQLGNTSKGTDVPFEFRSEKNSEQAKAWLLARQQPQNTLGIVLEPVEGEATAHAWLALENPTDPGAILYLYRLPLLTPRTGDNPY